MASPTSPIKRPTMPAAEDPVYQELQLRYRELRVLQDDRQMEGSDLTEAEQAQLQAAWKAYMEHVCLRGELGGF